MRQLIVKIICIGLLAAGSVLSVSAQEKKSTNPPAASQPAKAKHAPFKGTVDSVDKAASTVTLQGEKHQVIHITPQTKITTKKGQPATLDGVTPGTKVTGSKTETAPDKWEATSLKIQEAPKK